MEKRFQKYHRERGQATMEIAVAAVAIVFLVVGFFTIGGVGITSIKSLILTRYYAERNAENKTFGSVSPGNQISDWSYTYMNLNDNVIVLPYLAKDKPSYTGRELSGGYFENTVPSLSNWPDRTDDPEKADYLWQSFDPLVSRKVTSYNTTRLASLHQQDPVLPEEIKSEQNYLMRTSPGDSQVYKQHLKDGGWIDLRTIDITKWNSSVVAFPAFAPQK